MTVRMATMFYTIIGAFMRKTILFVCILLFTTGIAAHDWFEQTSGTTKDLTTVSVVTDSVAWIGGKEGTVLRTTDQGRSWISKGGGPELGNMDIVNIWAIDADRAIVTASPVMNSSTTAYVFRTADGGQNWTKVLTLDGGYGNGIYMFDANKGIFYSNPVNGKWPVWLTADGGQTWDTTGVKIPIPDQDEKSFANAICGNAGARIAVFGTNRSKIYITNDYGKTWTAKSTPGLVNSKSVCINYGRMMAGGEALISTMNEGESWTEVSYPGQGEILGMGVHDNWNWWFVSKGGSSNSGNKIIHTANFGNGFWDTAYTAPGNSAYLAMSTGRDDRLWIWAVREGGGITVGEHHHGEPTDVSGNDGLTPGVFALGQNYPNPFNPSTTIKFSLPVEDNIELKVFDMLGREMMTLASGRKSAGEHTLTFNAAGLASGTYIYILRAGGQVMAKKMLLVK